MTALPLQAAIFDFGGVFTTSPMAVLRDEAQRRGIDPDVLINTLMGDYGSDHDHPMHRVERGELPMSEARAWGIERTASLGVALDPIDVFMRVMDEPPRPAMLQLVRDIRDRGIATAMLTNNVRELSATWRSTEEWDSLFDTIVDSSEVGLRKPDPAIYHLAMERLGVNEPGRAVFVDDFDCNVDAARALGMQGVKVEEDPADAIRQVRALLDNSAHLQAAAR